MAKINNFVKVLLAPTAEQAAAVKAEATVEAEYGEVCVEGTQVTLAHHGSRSGNPAPCNWPNVPVLERGVILVSHIDLDTLGGIAALIGQKGDDPDFWAGAEYVDIHGPHRIKDLSAEVQSKLNAYYVFSEQHRMSRYTEVTDVTEEVLSHLARIELILRNGSESQRRALAEGQEWVEAAERATESKLVEENDDVRKFITDGVFCAASYYSPATQSFKKATVTLNLKTNAITVAFEDGGQQLSARALVQELWGPEAGGRDGIAGSPRGQEMTEADLDRAYSLVTERLSQL